MKAPIIIFGDDLYVFKNAQAAEAYLESPDVSSGLYTAFDSEGRLLRLHAGSTSDPAGPLSIVDVGRVRITDSEPAPTHQEELRKRLYKYLIRVRRTGTLTEQSSLQEVIDTGVALLGYT
jgi:hypothetical protein